MVKWHLIFCFIMHKRHCTIFWILIFFLFIQPFSAFSQEQKVRLKNLGPVSNVHLKSNYAYYLFHANQSYLVWYEGYTHTLFIYNLAKQSLKKVHLKKGRGPHEILQITGLAIQQNNVIDLIDYNNIKIIRLNHSGKFLKDYIPPVKPHPKSMLISGNYKIIRVLFNPKSLFFLHTANKYIPLKPLDKTKSENIYAVYKKEGYATIEGRYLIQVRKYSPNIYVYNLDKKKMIKKMKFDESKVDWGKPQTNSKGNKMMLPPSHVDVLSEDIAAVPGARHHVFMLARGSSQSREYGLNKLWEYDWKVEKFVGAHKFPFKVQYIATNDHSLFAYSKEKNKIYQFKVVPPK